MIITRLDGGLGNQMFQYAYGAYLAHRHRTTMCVDTRAYEPGPSHGYLLDKFRIEAAEADQETLSLLPRKYRDKTNNTRWLGAVRPTRYRRYKEGGFGFDSEHLMAPDDSYLVGYWQSEKFFPGMRQSLLQQFQLAQPLSRRSKKIAEQIDRPGSVAIHVRRGDYITNQSAAQLYQAIEIEHYHEAIEQWSESNYGRIQVFVFSNDIQWCQQNLQVSAPVHFVDHTTADTAYEDLALMSRAACNVIANSTFSWWAAWLNSRPDKVVVRPPGWFKPNTMDDSHVLPADWMSLRRGLIAAA